MNWVSSSLCILLYNVFSAQHCCLLLQMIELLESSDKLLLIIFIRQLSRFGDPFDIYFDA